MKLGNNPHNTVILFFVGVFFSMTMCVFNSLNEQRAKEKENSDA